MIRHRNVFVPAALALAISAAMAPATDAAETYKIDPVHTVVLFKIDHLGVSNFYGRFNDVSGEFTFDEKDPSKSSFEVTVKADSVDTNEAKRDQHIKSPDFLNAKQFPVITFKSKTIDKMKDGSYRATGEFQLHGVKKDMTIDIEPTGAGEDPWGGFRRGFETGFAIERSKHGMSYMQGGLGDKIELIVAVEGIRQ